MLVVSKKTSCSSLEEVASTLEERLLDPVLGAAGANGVVSFCWSLGSSCPSQAMAR